jgi:hypothetical protein
MEIVAIAVITAMTHASIYANQEFYQPRVKILPGPPQNPCMQLGSGIALWPGNQNFAADRRHMRKAKIWVAVELLRRVHRAIGGNPLGEQPRRPGIVS